MPKFLTATVNVSLYKLRRFKTTLEADLRRSGNGPIRQALHQWAVLIARFLTRRWYDFSLGGGNWKPLKTATLARKKHLKQLLYILRATDWMFQAFAPEFANKPGGITEDVPFGVRVGFGGGMQYSHVKGGPTLAEIAGFHQRGEGYLPVRKIIVPPDQDTINKMRDVMQKAVVEIANGARS